MPRFQFAQQDRRLARRLRGLRAGCGAVGHHPLPWEYSDYSGKAETRVGVRSSSFRSGRRHVMMIIRGVVMMSRGLIFAILVAMATYLVATPSFPAQEQKKADDSTTNISGTYSFLR